MLKNSLLAALGVTAMALSAQAAALVIPLQNAVLQTVPSQNNLASDHIVWVSDGTYPYPPTNGGFKSYWPSVPAPGTNSGKKDPSYDPYLVGNSAAVGSNIELSTLDGGIGSPDYQSWVLGSSRTTLTGNHGLGTPELILSSLTFGDWNGNSMQLAKDYLTAFVVGSLGIPLTPTQLMQAAYAFITGDTDGDTTPNILSPAYVLSDPNISYANLDDGVLKVGLAGLLDARSYLQGFANALNITLPIPTQISEVAKLTYKGETRYLYGFSATDTRQDACLPGQTNHAECSFSGNYEVTIPEPGSLALLCAGLLGLGFGRRCMRQC